MNARTVRCAGVGVVLGFSLGLLGLPFLSILFVVLAVGAVLAAMP